MVPSDFVFPQVGNTVTQLFERMLGDVTNAKLRGIRGKLKKKEIRNGAGEIRIWGIAWIGTSPQGKIKKFTLENDNVAYVESVFYAKKCCR